MENNNEVVPVISAESNSIEQIDTIELDTTSPITSVSIINILLASDASVLPKIRRNILELKF